MALCCGSLVFYRIDGYEPRVHGLARESELSVFPGSVTFGNQVAVLGAGGLESSLGALPRWSQACELVGRTLVLREEPAAFLSDSSLVLRPVRSDGAAAAFLLALLRWDPAARLRATECASHMYLQPTMENKAAEFLVERASEASLWEVVVESLRSGVAVDYERLMALALVPVAEQSSQRLCDSVVSDTVPTSATQQGAAPHVKRRRLRSNQSSAMDDVQASSSVPAVAVLTSQACVSQQALSQSVASGAGSEPRNCFPSSELALQSRRSLPLQACSCKGNCGRRSCKARKNALVRSGVSGGGYCDSFVSESSSKICSFCACEKCGERGRQEVHGMARWCYGCATKLRATNGTTRRQYFNVHGSWFVEPTWTDHLQLAARYAWANRLAPFMGGAFG